MSSSMRYSSMSSYGGPMYSHTVRRSGTPQFSASSVSGFGSRLSVSRVSSSYSRPAFGGAAGMVSSNMGGISNIGGISNQKETMQGLNDRLANYLEKVRNLESANAKLEHQIKEHMDSRGMSTYDLSAYEKPLNDLRQQVFDMTVENARLLLQIDNARLAADDFRVKWESELSIRQSVESDINGLRKVIDDTNIGRLQLESEIEALKEELVYIRKNHEEEVKALHSQVSESSVQVEVDSPRGQDLTKMIAEIRDQYEKVAQKNKDDAENWFKTQMETYTVEVQQNNTALDGAKGQVSDLRRQIQSLDVELQSLLSMKNSLEGTLGDTEHRYEMELQQLNGQIAMKESELMQLHDEMQAHANEYKKLLNITMKLEAEIATYRRLLDGEEVGGLVESTKGASSQIIKKTTQKIVDGKVVTENESVLVK
ncbi:keratin, type I cytoskeletal 18-like isoform X2 [Hypanus sabinus]|uniref:keratin, type I cytoskeletal 18-like isoform X2 n=1 Tax=Hypanus sabinus TaxID=79690 RepID=UPI0028C4CEBE|nr:keratin, type I cytoskeletal 18-like isoform X2 [Hypanus sabinus]